MSSTNPRIISVRHHARLRRAEADAPGVLVPERLVDRPQRGLGRAVRQHAVEALVRAPPVDTCSTREPLASFGINAFVRNKGPSTFDAIVARNPSSVKASRGPSGPVVAALCTTTVGVVPSTRSAMAPRPSGVDTSATTA